jgi:D-3-phosphoglycerate dehydrogenase / 2-oxoglutarate reductase
MEIFRATMSQKLKSKQEQNCVAYIAYDEPFSPSSWMGERFEKENIEFSIKNCSTEEEVIELGRNKDLLMTSSVRKLLNGRVFDQLDACRAIIRVGSGTDCIEVSEATKRGIMVVNTPDVIAEEVSDHAAALLLGCVRRISFFEQGVRNGHWRPDRMPSVQRMRGMTLGFVGFGRIAQALARKLAGFQLNYLAYDPYLNVEVAKQLGVKVVSLDELFKESDFISLHAQLTDETYHMLGAREFNLMKHHAILVNTARGGIVDQTALYQALIEGRIGGAGLDVLEQEPPTLGLPLLELDNVVITPHSAAHSDTLMDELCKAGFQTAVDLLAGKGASSVVNPEVHPWWS